MMTHELLRRLGEQGPKPTSMATVVKVEGSSYRQPGAKVVIDEHGKSHGLISGGCLEGDVALRQLKPLPHGSELVRYDLRDEVQGLWGLGLGCDGLVDVLIEKLDRTPAKNFFDALARVERLGEVVQVKTTLTHRDDGIWSIQDRSFEWGTAPPKSTARTTFIHEGETKVFTEWLSPSMRLFIFGAGEDARPLVSLAKQLNWSVTIIDWRTQWLSHPSFEGCSQIEGIDNLIATHQSRPTDAFVAMSHRYEKDREALAEITKFKWQYTGWLGPKIRTERMVKEVEEKGIELGQTFKSRMHFPIGLDLGAETPEEIALSIVAEILAVHNRRGGGFLRDRQAPLHPS